MPLNQTSCLPGMTAFAPRTLLQNGDLFTGLAWQDGALIAASTEGLRLFPSGGAAFSTLTQGDLPGLVVIGQTAYFLADHAVGAPNAQGKQPSTQALYSLPLAGGDPTLVLDMPLDGGGAVTDGTAIYFKGYGPGLPRVVIADGSRTDLPLPAGMVAFALALQDGFVYVAGQDFRAASGTTLNGLIARVPTSGGAPETLVANIGHPWNLVADAGGLTWVQDPPGFAGDSHIVRANRDGTGQRTLANHGASSLAVSGGDLYVAWDSISKIPLAGGAETVLVGGLKGPGLLTISSGNAAWMDPANQALSDPTFPALMTTCW
jgi:hypothetical protein